MAQLHMLGITVSLDRNTEYHDEGYVCDINCHTAMLDRKYGVVSGIDYSNTAIGGCITRQSEGIEHHHIFYLRRNPVSDCQVRGHEETHVIEKLNRLDLLAEKILREQRVKIDFGKIDEAEVRAYIGGIFSVLCHGMTIKMLDSVYGHSPLEVAKRVWKDSVVPERTVFW